MFTVCLKTGKKPDNLMHLIIK